MSQKQYAKVTEVNGIPRFSEALPLAAQHVIAMIVAALHRPLFFPESPD